MGHHQAVLNVTQLQNMLESSNVQVNGDDKIVVAAGLTWISSNTLTLSVQPGPEGSIIINEPISVAGAGGLVLNYSNGPAVELLSFGPKGKVTFWTTSSSLVINSNPYTLVNNISMLVSAAATNNYIAFANGYDASTDGTYSAAPVASISGFFNGLGNTISNLRIADKIAGDQVGLFGQSSAKIVCLRLSGIRVTGAANSQVGGLAGVNRGYIANTSVVGSVSTGKGTNDGGAGAIAGGLVGLNYKLIEFSYSAGSVKGWKNAIVGGFVGENGRGSNIGAISNTYSTASVTLDNGVCKGCTVGTFQNSAGGLVGVNNGTITPSFATGAVTGGALANLGGFIGLYTGADPDVFIDSSYSTGPITGGPGSSIGGSIGFDQTSSGDTQSVYWDTTTSGITDTSRGAGNISNDTGITGLTTAQLKSGLPAGFYYQSGWNEKATINGGLPYLLALPPP
jgi:hypothetical protein